jgi:hypothetical protein
MRYEFIAYDKPGAGNFQLTGRKPTRVSKVKDNGGGKKCINFAPRDKNSQTGLEIVRAIERDLDFRRPVVSHQPEAGFKS